jgi:hypothetical protein
MEIQKLPLKEVDITKITNGRNNDLSMLTSLGGPGLPTCYPSLLYKKRTEIV